jgi:hypothetical protein
MRQDNVVDTHVYVDIDIVYRDFLDKSAIWTRIREKLPLIEVWLENPLVLLRTRPSSRGNTHVELTFEQPVTVLQCVAIRAYLYDDKNRLMLDLIRYLKTGDTRRVNVLWSGKAIGTECGVEIMMSGLWQSWPLTGCANAMVSQTEASGCMAMAQRCEHTKREIFDEVDALDFHRGTIASIQPQPLPQDIDQCPSLSSLTGRGEQTRLPL